MNQCFHKTLFVLPYTPPPGLTTTWVFIIPWTVFNHSLHWLSRLAVGSGMPSGHIMRKYQGILDNVITEMILADLWRSEGFFYPNVLGDFLMCVQMLPLPTARRDSQCAGNDWRHSWEVVRPGGGVYGRTKSVLWKHWFIQLYIINKTSMCYFSSQSVL